MLVPYHVPLLLRLCRIRLWRLYGYQPTHIPALCVSNIVTASAHVTVNVSSHREPKSEADSCDPTFIPLKPQEEVHNLNFTSMLQKTYKLLFLWRRPPDTFSGLGAVCNEMLNNLPLSGVKFVLSMFSWILAQRSIFIPVAPVQLLFPVSNLAKVDCCHRLLSSLLWSAVHANSLSTWWISLPHVAATLVSK